MSMLYGIMLALLQWLALILFWKGLVKPFQSAWANPWLRPFDRIAERILTFVQTAVPLPKRGLAFGMMGLVLVCHATLLARLGRAAVAVGTFQSLVFAPVGFWGWMGIEVLHFVLFLLAFYMGVFFLRVWCWRRPLPGALGAALEEVTWPMPRLRLWVQGILFLQIAALLLLGGLHFHPTLHDILGASMKQFAPEVATFDVAKLDNLYHVALYLAGCMLFSSPDVLANMLLMLCFFSLLTLFARNPAMEAFLYEAFRLLRGRLPEIRLGPIGIMTIVAFFLLQLVAAVLITGWTLLFMAIAHVV